MGRYLLRRLGFVVFVLIGITVLTFLLQRVVPGDPARLIAGTRASERAVQEVRSQLGLDRPLWDQYGSYMSALFRGDLGQSVVTRNPVSTDLGSYVPATLELVLYALVIGSVVGIALGSLSAVRGGAVDVSGQSLGTAALSVPIFWLAVVLQLVFYSRLGVLPFGGRLDVGATPPPTITGLYTIDSLLTGNLSLFLQTIRHLILPATALAIPEIGLVAKTVRASMLEVLGKDYVRTARARGLSPLRIYFRHTLRNALLPVVTVLGLDFGLLISGTVLIESIFSWPGLGQYTFHAIASSDYNAVMGVTIVVAVAYVLINLVVDLLYVYLDPRVKLA
jgi:ABC-type dipeptide/oligopeptide/nickel transport system permease component